jgi:pantoate--beta-alanine ligase
MRPDILGGAGRYRPTEWTGRGMHPDSDSQHSRATAGRAGTLDAATSGAPGGAAVGGPRLGVVGAGRLGTALAAALRRGGVAVEGPAGRGEVPAGCDAIVLCVPDGEIPAASKTVAGAAQLVGHTSGATPLAAMAAAERAGAALFGLHPLQTFAQGARPEGFEGAGCAVAGSTPGALEFAAGLARRLGMTAFEIDDEGRAAYHAAASVASNFVVTLQAAAESIAAGAGLEPAEARALLAPLLRRTVENVAEAGPRDALTGPVARGDHATVAAQRAAVEEVAPHLLDLFDELVAHTRTLAAARLGGPGAPAVAPAKDVGSARLRTIHTVRELRQVLAVERRAGRTIGLVPTMGSFHEGHLSLMRQARKGCDVVVVSLFVNPAQFGPNEDLETYPRDEARDTSLAEVEGVDVLFAPPVEEVYPEGFDTRVTVGGLTDVLDGDPARRGPGHFEGVATVVAKLFNMVEPDVTYFGQKDAQQALVIRKLVRELDFDVRIQVCPTVREPDGLALSSRNAYLSPEERERALGLSRALRAAEQRVAEGERDAAAVLAAARAELDAAGIEPEYLELRSASDLSPVDLVNGSTLLAVAARVGRARLIDNAIFGEGE